MKLVILLGLIMGGQVLAFADNCLVTINTTHGKTEQIVSLDAVTTYPDSDLPTNSGNIQIKETQISISECDGKFSVGISSPQAAPFSTDWLESVLLPVSGRGFKATVQCPLQ